MPLCLSTFANYPRNAERKGWHGERRFTPIFPTHAQESKYGILCSLSIEIPVNKDGDLFWNEKLVDTPTLLTRLKVVSVKLPPPEVDVHGDQT